MSDLAAIIVALLGSGGLSGAVVGWLAYRRGAASVTAAAPKLIVSRDSITAEGQGAANINVTQTGQHPAAVTAVGEHDVVLRLRAELNRLADLLQEAQAQAREKDGALERLADKRAQDGRQLVMEVTRQLERVLAELQEARADIRDRAGTR